MQSISAIKEYKHPIEISTCLLKMKSHRTMRWNTNYLTNQLMLERCFYFIYFPLIIFVKVLTASTSRISMLRSEICSRMNNLGSGTSSASVIVDLFGFIKIIQPHISSTSTSFEQELRRLQSRGVSISSIQDSQCNSPCKNLPALRDSQSLDDSTITSNHRTPEPRKQIQQHFSPDLFDDLQSAHSLSTQSTGIISHAKGDEEENNNFPCKWQKQSQNLSVSGSFDEAEKDHFHSNREVKTKLEKTPEKNQPTAFSSHATKEHVFNARKEHLSEIDNHLRHQVFEILSVIIQCFYWVRPSILTRYQNL